METPHGWVAVWGILLLGFLKLQYTSAQQRGRHEEVSIQLGPFELKLGVGKWDHDA